MCLFHRFHWSTGRTGSKVIYVMHVTWYLTKNVAWEFAGGSSLNIWMFDTSINDFYAMHQLSEIKYLIQDCIPVSYHSYLCIPLYFTWDSFAPSEINILWIQKCLPWNILDVWSNKFKQCHIHQFKNMWHFLNLTFKEFIPFCPQ